MCSKCLPAEHVRARETIELLRRETRRQTLFFTGTVATEQSRS